MLKTIWNRLSLTDRRYTSEDPFHEFLQPQISLKHSNNQMHVKKRIANLQGKNITKGNVIYGSGDEN